MSGAEQSCVLQASGVAIDGRALLIEGAPGTGKSSLALALIARGGLLIGDDGVTITRPGPDAALGPDVAPCARLIVSAPPNIAGLIEVRGVGIVRRPLAPPTPLALILTLDAAPPRLPEAAEWRDLLGCRVPVLPFLPGAIAPAERALVALELHGLATA